MQHYAKYYQNRFNRGRDIAIFRYFKMAAAAILDFQNLNFLKVWGVVTHTYIHKYTHTWNLVFRFFSFLYNLVNAALSIRVVQLFFAGLTNVTNAHTHRQTHRQKDRLTTLLCL